MEAATGRVALTGLLAVLGAALLTWRKAAGIALIALSVVLVTR